MAQAVSFGQITITDLTDIGSLSVYPTANQPLTVIYNPDQNTFTPNWGSSNLVLTPVIYYGGKQLTAASQGVTITWTRQEGNATPTALTTNETVSGGVLTVKANKFTVNSTMLSYIIKVDYVEPESSVPLRAEGKITFTLVKQPAVARTAVITGDQVFKYNSSQTLVGESSITLNAEVTGAISITAWQYQDGDGNWQTYPNAGTADTLTVNATDSTFFDDKCVIKLVTSDPNVFDIHTITNLRDGVAGTSTIAAVLTNEDQMLPANSSGTITSYDGAESQLIIYRGSKAETSSWNIALSTTGTLTYQVSSDGSTWNSSSTTGSHWSYVKVTAMSSDTATITFTATKSGETQLSKTFSIVRVKTGADGKDPVIYTVEPVALAANKDKDGAFTPTSIAVNAYSKTGSANKVAYTGRFKMYAGSTSGTVLYTSTQNESAHTITSANMTSAASAGYITVQLYASGGTTTLLDTQTIVITSDGQPGGQGPQGEAGVDAVNVILGNQADVIPCTSANKTSTAMTITIPFSGYKGTTKVACTVATPAQLFGVSATVTQATATRNGSIVYSIQSGTSVSSASGTISLTFTCESKTIPMEYRWTRSTAATNGTNAVLLQLLTPKGTVFTNGTGSLTIEGVLYNGTTKATTSATWAWAKYSGSGYAPISGETSNTLTVAGSSVDGFASFKCTATYGGNPYEAYVSLIDKTDPLQVEVLSSIGDQIVNGAGAGAFYVMVWRNGVEVDPLKSTRFLTSAPSGSSAGDYYYHVDTTAKTVTLKKYSGSSWSNAPSSDLPTGSYIWGHMDANGNTITADGLATSGKVIYIDGSLFDKKMISTVEVTI